MPPQTIKAAGLLQRTASIARSDIVEETRTVKLSVSSEALVPRWFGQEILDHSPRSIRFERIRKGAPVLLDHYGNQVGVVESFELAGKRTVATIRFGNSQEAQDVFADVRDGIRQNVSIGYRVHKMVLETGSDDEEQRVYRVTDWEPYEVSIVSIPADISVGVGRAADFAHDIMIERGLTMDKDNDNGQGTSTAKSVTETAATTPQPIDRDALTTEVRNQEQRRIRDLEALGERFERYDGHTMARQFIRDGRSVAEFRNSLLEKIPTLDKAGSGDKPAGALDLSAADTKRYSLLRAINAATTGDWSKAGFEQECSVAVSDKLGREARGFYVPYDVLLGKRTMSTAAATGGRLVNDEYMPGEFIDRLRQQTLVSRLGARYLTGLVGNPDIPGGATGATFYWLGEDENVSNSDITFRSVNLSPKTVAGAVAMTRRLMLQSSPDIEGLVQDELLYGMALAIDTAVIKGSGTNNQPKGILNQADLLTVALADEGAPTRKELRQFKTVMKKANSFLGNPIFLTTPDIEAHLEDEPIDVGSGRFLLENGRALGHTVEGSNIMPDNSLILGNFADVIIGMWGVLDLMPDKAAKAASGGLVLRVFQDVDVAIRHPQSFVKATV